MIFSDVITLFPQEKANLECFVSICLVPNILDYVYLGRETTCCLSASC